jgi:trehalose-phosphatase
MPNWVSRVVEADQSDRPLVLLFDYDGTLTPLVRHPQLAVLGSRTREALLSLAGHSGVTLGVLSGRPLEDLRERVRMRLPYLAGSGGLELEIAGQLRTDPGGAAIQSTLDAISRQMASLLRKHPGTWIERKPAALAIHYRGLLPLNAICFRSATNDLLARFSGIRYREVCEALEVTPAGGWDKGAAVRAILTHLRSLTSQNPFPVYYGDSPNDDEGMDETLAAGGIAIGIGSEPPMAATYQIASPEILTERLRELDLALKQSRSIEIQPWIKCASNEKSDTPGLLIVDPDRQHGRRLAEEVRHLGWHAWVCESTDIANRILEEQANQIRVVLVDLELPGLLGARTLAEWELHPGLLRCGMAVASPYMASAFERLSNTPLFCKPVLGTRLDRHLRHYMEASPASA